MDKPWFEAQMCSSGRRHREVSRSADAQLLMSPQTGGSLTSKSIRHTHNFKLQQHLNQR